jgi:hypothetical protein
MIEEEPKAQSLLVQLQYKWPNCLPAILLADRLRLCWYKGTDPELLADSLVTLGRIFVSFYVFVSYYWLGNGARLFDIFPSRKKNTREFERTSSSLWWRHWDKRKRGCITVVPSTCAAARPPNKKWLAIVPAFGSREDWDSTSCAVRSRS